MQVLRADNPLTIPGLTMPQRLAYAFTLFGWFDAWRSLGYLLLPVAVLCTGAVPIRAPLGTFAIAFAVTFTLQQLALWLLGRGWQRPWLAIMFDLVRLPSNLAATMTLLRGREGQFQVTPKGPDRRASTPDPASPHPVGGCGGIGSCHRMVRGHDPRPHATALRHNCGSVRGGGLAPVQLGPARRRDCPDPGDPLRRRTASQRPLPSGTAGAPGRRVLYGH
jgi:hypothetical protein